MPNDADMITLAAKVVTAFVGRHSVRPDELPGLMKSVHEGFMTLAAPAAGAAPAPELKPAVPIRKSVTDEYIISLEDGRRFKSMKRYLSRLGMTPDDYRTKWGLPRDYPMVAPGYSATRSKLAKSAGLGANRLGRKADAPGTAPSADDIAWEAAGAGNAEGPAPAKRRGRPRKAG